MEKLVRVSMQGPLASKNWTNKNNENVVINSVTLLLTDGVDCFVAEATDQLALQLSANPLLRDYLYNAQCRIEVREWKNKDGETVQKNVIRLLKIQAI